MTKYCPDCGKETKGYGKRCASCARIESWKNRTEKMKSHLESLHSLFRTEKQLKTYSDNGLKYGPENFKKARKVAWELPRTKKQLKSVRKRYQIFQRAHASIYEKQFKKTLENENILFEWQEPIDFPKGSFINFTIADFLINKIIVEVDDLKHFYNPFRDFERDKICRKLGYKILRFTHKEIETDLKVCIKKVKEEILK